MKKQVLSWTRSFRAVNVKHMGQQRTWPSTHSNKKGKQCVCVRTLSAYFTSHKFTTVIKLGIKWQIMNITKAHDTIGWFLFEWSHFYKDCKLLFTHGNSDHVSTCVLCHYMSTWPAVCNISKLWSYWSFSWESHFLSSSHLGAGVMGGVGIC